MIVGPVDGPEESRMIPDTLYYDRDGNPIGLEEWARLREDPAYCRVAQTVIGFNNAETAVLTVWVGVDCTLSTAVLATAIVAGGRLNEVREYDTEAEAREGHKDVVKHIVDNLRPHGLPVVFDGVNERWDEFVGSRREV
jgi:hypothetical protein